jgi:hypothetical protein
MPERLRTFDLPRELPGANQKRFPLRDLGVSAVKVNNFMLSSTRRSLDRSLFMGEARRRSQSKKRGKEEWN